MPTFATVDDFEAQAFYRPDDEIDAEGLLPFANKQVEKAVRNDQYATTPNGLPVEPFYLEAMMRAACIQVYSWHIGNVTVADLLAGDIAAEPDISSTKIGSAALSINSGRADRARAVAMRQLVPAAFEELRSVGLASAAVVGGVGLW